MQLSAGRSREAAVSFRSAATADPKHPGAYFGLGRALLAQGDTKGALSAFQDAARVAPDNPLPLIAIGEVYSRQGGFDRALASIDKALVLEPDLIAAQLARADVLVASGRATQGMEELERSAAKTPAPASAVLLVKLGSLQQSAGKADAAIASYKRATEADPKMAVAWNNLAWLTAEGGRDLEQPLKWSKRAVDLAPTVPTYLDTLGFIYLARGEADPAVEALTRAVKMAPAVPEFQYRLGLALEKQGHADRALESYKTALKSGRPFTGDENARQRVAALGGKGSTR
jgi:tetratricopeptide (TPR) repeat protein